MLRSLLRKVRQKLFGDPVSLEILERQMLLMGVLATENILRRESYELLSELEFRVFSQWGDDGIIQFLTHHLNIGKRVFIEFGVENYQESNTRFLMMKDNWSGLVIDSSPQNIEFIKSSYYYWKYNLAAVCKFVTEKNIQEILACSNLGEQIGLLHIDIDGNDYWIWNAIKDIQPAIVIVEYNGNFGCLRPISIPYCENFDRTKAHSSNLYYGCSLPALEHLARQKGYAFIGCNGAGNNAYFVCRNLLNSKITEKSVKTGFVPPLFREARSPVGKLSFLDESARQSTLKGLPIINVVSGEKEML